LLAHANGGDLIPADSPVQDFSLACRGVEIPGAISLDDRYRHRPILGANIQSESIRLFHQTVHFVISPDEISAVLGILGFVSGRDDFRPSGPRISSIAFS